MKKLKSWLLPALMLAAGFVLVGCNDDDTAGNGAGSLRLYITDSPIDAANVEAVVITITSIEVNGSDGWETIREFDEAASLNLLEYQQGETFFLAEEDLAIGNYSQIRLHLDTQEQSQGNISNPGCFIRFIDGTQKGLFIPSGGQSGYSVVGEFEISSNAVQAITIDFDVRKSVVEAGNSGNYLLKPNMRLIVNEEASMIEGSISNMQANHNLVVYSYKTGEYNETELEPNFDSQLFLKAISSTSVNDDGSFRLAFLQSGNYQLVVASYDNEGNFIEVVKESDSINLDKGAVAELSLSIEIGVGIGL